MSGRLINVNFSQDPSYRWKMPPLESRKEGRGNGVRTILLNPADVAKAIHREPEHIVKFIGFELGASSFYDKTTSTGRIQGEHQLVDLMSQLRVYIEKYLLCQNCKAPETTLLPPGEDSQSDSFTLRCTACGARYPLPQHKLSDLMNRQFRGSSDESERRKHGVVIQEPIGHLRKLVEESIPDGELAERLRMLREEGSLGKRERIPAIVAALFKDLRIVSQNEGRVDVHSNYLIPILGDNEENQLLFLDMLTFVFIRDSERDPGEVLSIFLHELFTEGVIPDPEVFRKWRDCPIDFGHSHQKERLNEAKEKMLTHTTQFFHALDEAEEEESDDGYDSEYGYDTEESDDESDEWDN